MCAEINHHRWRFLGAAAMAVAAAELGTIGSAEAQSGKMRQAQMDSLLGEWKPGRGIAR